METTVECVERCDSILHKESPRDLSEYEPEIRGVQIRILVILRDLCYAIVCLLKFLLDKKWWTIRTRDIQNDLIISGETSCMQRYRKEIFLLGVVIGKISAPGPFSLTSSPSTNWFISDSIRGAQVNDLFTWCPVTCSMTVIAFITASRRFRAKKSFPWYFVQKWLNIKFEIKTSYLLVVVKIRHKHENFVVAF